MPIISIKNLSKCFKIPKEKSNTLKVYFVNGFKRGGYEKFDALKDISFEVEKGEWVGIIGRNGSGKSTLLKIIAGIYSADKGSIKTRGKIVPFLELGVGFNPELSARENIFLNGAILGMEKEEIKRKFNQIIEFAEIEKFVDQKLKNFSSGMQVRLAFSVAIQAKGDIYLLDEVLAVGDAIFQKKTLEKLLELKKEGKTILFVSHDLESIKKYTSKTILLTNGNMTAFNNTEKAVANYVNKNIEREDKQIVKENKKKKEEKLTSWGNKDILITDVIIKDGQSNEKYSFKTGDDINICIFYEGKKDTIKPHFGIGFKDSSGKMITITNHLRNNQIIESIKNGQKGIIKCNIPKNQFLEGFYYLSVFIYEDKTIPNPAPIHHVSDIKKISITNIHKLSEDGVFMLNCNWKI